MTNFLDTVRSYFEVKNRVWLTGNLEPLRRAANLESDKNWWVRAGAAVERKRSAASWRRGDLLRAHTRVNVRDIKQDKEKALVHADIDEQVTWVYRDGLDYGVESRVIRHQQKWRSEDGLWRLKKELEADEVNHFPVPPRSATLLPLAMTVPREMPQTRDDHHSRVQFYDRMSGFRYAELWWNGWNPAYPQLEDDCTNFVSQCLFAGHLPMQQTDSRSTGWWFRFHSKETEPWSYSWTTSHALYSYLLSQRGVKRVSSARDLKVGDVIFYDWSGQGTFHHSTFVVDFDHRGDPLVNAHTDASWHRHYLYLDSRAWTARTRYAFVHLPDTLA